MLLPVDSELKVVDVPEGAWMQRQKTGRWTLLGGFLAVFSVFVWLLLIHNRFLTPYEGWFSYYGLLIEQGKLPYRDFYFFTQPLTLGISWGIERFGDKLIYFRYYGLAERVVITSGLYYLLSRQFSAAAALIATVASSYFFVSYITDALFTYIYTCLLFLILGLVCLQKGLKSSGRQRYVWVFLAGVAGAFSFFTKQSNGLFAAVSLALSIAVISPSSRQSLRDLSSFSAGFAAGSLPFVYWLTANGLWAPYFAQVFHGAAASKGGVSNILTGFLSRQITFVPLTCFLLAVALATVLTRRGRLSIRHSVSDAGRGPFIAVASYILCVVGAAIYAVKTIDPIPLFLIRYASTITVEVMMYALLAATAWLTWVVASRPFGRPTAGMETPVMLLIASFFWTWSCGMSYRVEEQAAIPCLALFLAFGFDRIQLGRGKAMAVVTMLFATVLVFQSTFQKWNVAFNWEGWRASVSEQQAHSHWEQISDYALNPREVVLYDEFLDDIAKYARPNDQVVTFPGNPLFSFVGRHAQPTFAPVEFWDVCPDDVARADAERILKSPPGIIVDFEMAGWVWKEHELGFRGGRPSGQREFHEAMMRLTESGRYSLVRTYASPFYKMNLNLWIQKR